LKNELDKQLNAWNGYVDAHAGNYSRMNARIAELEQTVTEATERISYLNTTNSMRRTTIEEQTSRIAELEADIARKNGALHACDQTIAALEARLATIPLASMERHIMGIDSAADYHEIVAYFFPQEATA